MKTSALLLIVLFALSACDQSIPSYRQDASAEIARINASNADRIWYGNDDGLTQAERISLEQGADSLYKTLNALDWEANADLLIPEIFDADTLRDVMIEFATHYTNMGWRSTFENLRFGQVSPFIPYHKGRCCILTTRADVRVWFTDEWEGNRENYLQMIKDRYPWGEVSYDAVAQEYNIKNRENLFCFTPADTLDWRFCQPAGMSKAAILEMFQTDDLLRLQSWNR